MCPTPHRRIVSGHTGRHLRGTDLHAARVPTDRRDGAVPLEAKKWRCGEVPVAWRRVLVELEARRGRSSGTMEAHSALEAPRPDHGGRRGARQFAGQARMAAALRVDPAGRTTCSRATSCAQADARFPERETASSSAQALLVFGNHSTHGRNATSVAHASEDWSCIEVDFGVDWIRVDQPVRSTSSSIGQGPEAHPSTSRLREKDQAVPSEMQERTTKAVREVKERDPRETRGTRRASCSASGSRSVPVPVRLARPSGDAQVI